jgi:porin
LTFWGIGLALACLATCAVAQSPDPTKIEPPTKDVNAGATYDGETVSGLSGGAKRGSVYHGSLQVQATLDLERLFGWMDTTAFVYGMWLHGGQPDDLTGGAQGVSSITGPRGARFDEAWVQRNFLQNRLSVLGGRSDVNSEFYRLHSAALFLNSSFGMGPELSQSGPFGPSAFPSTALGARVQYKATPELVLRGAVVNAEPFNRPPEANATTRNGNGALVVSEAA